MALLTGCACPAARSAEARIARASATGIRLSRTSGLPCRRTPTARLPHRARARDVERVAPPLRQRPRAGSQGPARGRVARVSEERWSSIRATRRRSTQVMQLEQDHPRSARGLPSANPRSFSCASRHARRRATPTAESRRRASRSTFDFTQRQPARHPDLHRQRHRHQRHLRPRASRIGPSRSSSTGVHSNRRSTAPVVERVVLYGPDERTIIVAHGHDAESLAVRAAGRAHVPLSRTPTRPSCRRC